MVHGAIVALPRRHVPVCIELHSIPIDAAPMAILEDSHLSGTPPGGSPSDAVTSIAAAAADGSTRQYSICTIFCRNPSTGIAANTGNCSTVRCKHHCKCRFIISPNQEQLACDSYNSGESDETKAALSLEDNSTPFPLPLPPALQIMRTNIRSSLTTGSPGTFLAGSDKPGTDCPCSQSPGCSRSTVHRGSRVSRHSQRRQKTAHLLMRLSHPCAY